jgi:hypothetical protein
MDPKMCRPGQRYLFYDRQNNKQFRACFLDVVNVTLRVTKYEKNDSNKYLAGMVTMPLGWIEKADTLDMIVEGNILLPEEIMIDIDGFL